MFTILFWLGGILVSGKVGMKALGEEGRRGEAVVAFLLFMPDWIFGGIALFMYMNDLW